MHFKQTCTALAVFLHALAAQSAGPAAWIQQKPVREGRCAPQLLCIGTQKSGTTSWDQYLRSGYHPSIHVPPHRKELHYFDWLIERNVSTWQYLSSFSHVTAGDDPVHGHCALLQGNASMEIVVNTEATPRYFFHPLAAQRAYALLPDTRILLLLRHPGKRVVSHFNMDFQIRIQQGRMNVMGKEQTELGQEYADQLMQMIGNETSILRRCYGGLLDDRDYLAVDRCMRFADVSMRRRDADLQKIEHMWRSVYVDHLARWLMYYPPQQFLIWVAEDFKRSPAEHMRQMVKWLGLSVADINEKVLQQVAYQIPYIARTPPAAKTALYNFLQSHNDRLFSLMRRKGFSDVTQRLDEVWSKKWK